MDNTRALYWFKGIYEHLLRLAFVSFFTRCFTKLIDPTVGTDNNESLKYKCKLCLLLYNLVYKTLQYNSETNKCT